MKANETKLIRIIEGTNQYLVPHFQRPYTWERKNWATLWSDIETLVDATATSRSDHFMGAIVTAPAHSVPEGVTKYLLIDGQQRLTTLLLLLAAIRDRAKHLDDLKLSARINDLYLTNRYQEGNDQYKLLPTQGDAPSHNDRSAFLRIIDASPEAHSKNGIHLAYSHFSRLLKDKPASQLADIASAILNHVFLVSIVLERDDNPYAIFESLNAKGQPLSQSDLVRNFFFMSIDSDRHDQIHRTKWSPMEREIGRDNMEAYIRHFLIRKGTLVKESDVYFTLKREVDDKGREYAESMLDDLVRVAAHYAKLLSPEREPNPSLRDRLGRLVRLRATVCYPFLLNMFEMHQAGRITTVELLGILDTLENFIVRRYVCGTVRAELNEVFAALHRQASRFTSVLDGVREVLASRNYPTDHEFHEALQTRKLYGAGEVKDRAKFILERLEDLPPQAQYLEADSVRIEHIMPQKLTPWWQKHLGPDADETHELYLHTIGNLTLVTYSSDHSHADFYRKRDLLSQVKIRLNAKIIESAGWAGLQIEERAKDLANRALRVWPDFAPAALVRRSRNVTGTTPRRLFVLGTEYPVQSWQDVLRHTLTQVSALGDDIVIQLQKEFPKYIRSTPAGLRTPRSLGDDLFYESHFNAEQIHRLCSQIAQHVGFTASDWRIETD